MRPLFLGSALSCIAALVFTIPTSGETIINVPPDSPPRRVGNDEVLNVFDGGDLPSLSNWPFRANAGSTVNVFGGTVGVSFDAKDGSVVNIFGGTVGNAFNADSGSLVNISGGVVGSSFDANSGSLVNLSGGTVGGRFSANSDSRVNITGGTVLDRFEAFSGSTVVVVGEEFQIDGQLGRAEDGVLERHVVAVNE